MNPLLLKLLFTLSLTAAGVVAAQTSVLTFSPVQHVSSSLSAAVDETWASLHDLGFVGHVKALTAEHVSYLFVNGTRQLEVTFSQQDEGVLVVTCGSGMGRLASAH